jgi:hypothetical protein
MATGKLYTYDVSRTAGVFSLDSIDIKDFSYTGSPSTQTSWFIDDVALTADDRFVIKYAYPTGSVPASSTTIASILAAAQTLVESVSVPDAPTIGTATAGASQVTVTFTPPASNGGAAITSYTVTSNTGGFTASGSASPIVVPMGSDKTAHTFTVTATNVAGTGAASAASNSVSAT